MRGAPSAEERHWTDVESIRRVGTVPPTVTLTACNHGVRHVAIDLDLAGFANRFLGFVAVTDFAA